MKALSPTQRALLEFIVRFIATNGYPPTAREMCRHFGWASTNWAFEVLDVLERKKAIVMTRGKARAIRVLPPFAPASPDFVAGALAVLDHAGADEGEKRRVLSVIGALP